MIVLLLLPPANEVWGKVIFSEACVKNFVHGGGRAWLQGACMVARGVCLVAGGHVWLLGGVRRIRRDTVNERAVRILLECMLVLNCVEFVYFNPSYCS